jgi:hypothetical protein
MAKHNAKEIVLSARCRPIRESFGMRGIFYKHIFAALIGKVLECNDVPATLSLRLHGAFAPILGIQVISVW